MRWMQSSINCCSEDIYISSSSLSSDMGRNSGLTLYMFAVSDANTSRLYSVGSETN